ncbi:MAG: LIC_13387 family protein [Acetobacteraceae bacterium]
MIGSMQSVHFDGQGFSRSYWNFFVGAGLSVGVFFLFASVLAWQLGRIPPTTLASMRVVAWAFASLLPSSQLSRTGQPDGDGFSRSVVSSAARPGLAYRRSMRVRTGPRLIQRGAEFMFSCGSSSANICT